MPIFGFDDLHANKLKGMNAAVDMTLERGCHCGCHISPNQGYCGECGLECKPPGRQAADMELEEQFPVQGDKPREFTPVRIQVAKCFKTRCAFAHVVPQKGVDPERYAVDWLVKDMEWLGHSRVILRAGHAEAPH